MKKASKLGRLILEQNFQIGAGKGKGMEPGGGADFPDGADFPSAFLQRHGAKGL